MHLGELKAKPIDELLSIAGEMGIENIARSKKQDVIFSILKKHSKSGEDIEGEGVLEILNDTGLLGLILIYYLVIYLQCKHQINLPLLIKNYLHF